MFSVERLFVEPRMMNRQRGDDLCNFFMRLLYSDKHLCSLDPLKTSWNEVKARIDNLLKILNSSDSKVSTVILNAETKAANAANDAKAARAAEAAKAAKAAKATKEVANAAMVSTKEATMVPSKEAVKAAKEAAKAAKEAAQAAKEAAKASKEATKAAKEAKAIKVFQIRVTTLLEEILKLRLKKRCTSPPTLFAILEYESPKYFSSQVEVDRTIKDVVELLRCSSPYSLGILESCSGRVGGHIYIKVEPYDFNLNCSAYPFGYPIPGDLRDLNDFTLKIQEQPRYILVVESQIMFDKLLSYHLEKFPSILFTPGGYPDFNTRYFLNKLRLSFPDLPIFALVDWSPTGIATLSAFQFGCKRMGLKESDGNQSCCCLNLDCNVKWLGVHSEDLPPRNFLYPLLQRDFHIAESLISSDILPNDYRIELGKMMELGARGTTEHALKKVDKLEKLVERCNHALKEVDKLGEVD